MHCASVFSGIRLLCIMLYSVFVLRDVSVPISLCMCLLLSLPVLCLEVRGQQECCEVGIRVSQVQPIVTTSVSTFTS